MKKLVYLFPVIYFVAIVIVVWVLISGIVTISFDHRSATCYNAKDEVVLQYNNLSLASVAGDTLVTKLNDVESFYVIEPGGRCTIEWKPNE